MAISRTLLKAIALFEPDPAQCIRQLNDLLAVDNDRMMFVTLLFGILDPATGLGVPGPHAVTVHAADGTTADALATAISVLDEKEAGKLLDRFPGSSALLFDPVGGPPRVLGVFPGYPNH